MAAKLATMIPPVSVCHQLSWIGNPRCRLPRSTPSGFSGSPTDPNETVAQRKVEFAGEFTARLHQHANGRWGGIPHGYASS